MRDRAEEKMSSRGGQKASVIEKELGHPILAFTIARVLP